jgi:hypothetical protein
MAAGVTYEKIASTTLGSAAASVTFSSIPGTYTDLILVFNGAASGTVDFLMRVGNGSVDTGSNYSATYLGGSGSVAASSRYTSQTSLYLDASAALTTAFESVYIMNLMNYANITTYKTVLVRNNTVSRWVEAGVGLWRSTSAINTIELKPTSGTFSTGSTFNLYGIAAA